MTPNFSGTRGNTKAKIMFVAESYGQEEARQNQPLVGASGRELDNLLSEVGIDPNECFFTNVINARPTGNDMKLFFHSNAEVKAKKLIPTRGLYPKDMVKRGIEELKDVIAYIQPKAIVGFGNYTLWALTEDSFGIGNQKSKISKQGYKIPSGIGLWRGSQLRDSTFGIPFMPTYHPAAYLRQWSWRSLVKHDLLNRLPMAFDGRWEDFERRYIVDPSYAEAVDTLEFLIAACDKKPTIISCDIETRSSLIACIGFGWSDRDAICIPFMLPEAPFSYYTEDEELVITMLIRKLLSHSNLRLAGQNFIYDIQYIYRFWQVIPKIYYDTMIMQHVIYPGTPLALYHISSLYCKYHKFWKDEGKEWDPKMDKLQFWRYNCTDCVTTYEAVFGLLKMIDYHKQQEQFAWQIRQLELIVKTTLRGVNIDRAAKKDMYVNLLEASSRMEEKLEYLLPTEVYPRKPKQSPWYTSPSQQCEIFYDILGVPVIKSRDTGNPTVDDKALEKMSRNNELLHPLISRLQQYRSLSVFIDFANMKLDHDGRARCSFTPTAETFRLKSSENPFGSGRNLQNIPKGREDVDHD